ERFLIAFGATVDRTHIGNKIRDLRAQPGEFVLPGFVAAVGERDLDRIAIELAHLRLGGLALDQLLGHGLLRSVGDALIAAACAPAKTYGQKHSHHTGTRCHCVPPNAPLLNNSSYPVGHDPGGVLPEYLSTRERPLADPDVRSADT